MVAASTLRRATEAAARAAAPNTTPATVVVANPNKDDATRRSTEHIHTLRRVARRTNTAKTLDPKLAEFKEYCLSECSKEDAPHHVSKDKVWWFMIHQAFRKPKKKGGKRKGAEVAPKFNKKEYDEIVLPFKSTTAAVTMVTPVNPVGYECVNQHKKVIKKLHEEQKSAGTNGVGWGFIWTDDCTNLMQHVKERKPALDKLNCKEKQSQEFAPCLIVSQYDNIEQLFWEDCAASPSGRSLCSRLRQRCCFLLLTSSVLRSESLHRAETSDFFGLTPPMKCNDIHPMFLQIHQIPIGKTTYGTPQWGRAGRHFDPKRCSIGGTALYLETRESINKEFGKLTKEQWFTNSEWYDIKFLADCHGNTKEEMKSDTYGDKVRDILSKLGLPMNKILHLGRNIGAKHLDCLEVDAAEVKRMGQWNQSIHEKAYSSKLPMLAIRTLAGFTACDGMHFNTRTQVSPSEELVMMTALGKLSINMLDQINVDEGSLHPTAVGVLQWFQSLAIILIQDMAAIKALYKEEERSMKALERELPVLRTKEFEEFTQQMKKALEAEKSPFDASLERVMPGVHARFVKQEEATNKQHASVMEAIGDLGEVVATGFSCLAERELTARAESSRIVGEALIETGNNVIARSHSNPPDSDDSNLNEDFTGNDEQAMSPSSPPTGQLPDERPPRVPEPGDYDYISPEMQKPIDNPMVGRPPVAEPDPYLIKLRVKHACLMDLWDEWFGEGEFADEFGGVNGRNSNAMCKGWRKKACIDASHFSRHRRIVEAINKEAKTRKCQPQDVIEDWEAIFSRVNLVTGAFVKALQQMGKIVTRKSRGKTQKDESTTNNNEEQQQ